MQTHDSFLKRVIPFFLLLFPCFFIAAQGLPTEKEHFGFTIGDDYQLANYTSTARYFELIARNSDRAKLVDIGKTEEGRTQYMMIVSSPANIKNLAEYQSISRKLARAEDLSLEEARVLSEKGKAVVWIDGGIHATEVVGTHQLIATITQLVNRKDPETERILDNVIILLTHINPDGQELVSDWYMRNQDSSKRATNIPRLYQKYIGHDNNRDYFMMNMKETQNVSRQLFVEWLPQIMYNHHQTGPAGSVVAGPPYRDPFNYVYDPLLVTSLDAVGAAMNSRLNAENKPGYTQRAGSNYSTWWNGGLRTTPYFHNMIGLLTEIIGSPTPEKINFMPNRLTPDGATPFPVTPQAWHFRQSIDYSISLNYAVLDYAARNRNLLLLNIYKMGQNSIRKGRENTWTHYPRLVDSAFAMYVRDSSAKLIARGRPAPTRSSAIPTGYYDSIFRNPAFQDARTYIIPASQADFPTATRFVNALIWSGIRISKAKSAFTAAGKSYPAGSFIVSTAQAFRPHIIDMFEPQDHPNDFEYPGGPPIRPYDAAGWTLAYQMGVSFDRLLVDVQGDFETIPYGQIQEFTPAVFSNTAKHYAIPASQNNAFILINDLLRQGVSVARMGAGTDQSIPAGSFVVQSSAKATGILQDAAANWGVRILPMKTAPANTSEVKPARVAIWNNYGGSMPAGWLQWLMEQYHFAEFRFIYSKEIDAGKLARKYDIIIFNGSGIPGTSQGRAVSRGPKEEEIPAEFRDRLGSLTVEKSIPVLDEFIRSGGKVITIGSSASLAFHLQLPVEDHLVEFRDGKKVSLPSTKYYIPGSILEESTDTTQRSNYGMKSTGDVYFANSPVFRIRQGAKGITPLSWIATDKPLRSGWAWGQNYLQDGITSFEAVIGKGSLLVFGPDIIFRAQSHAGFKRLFNNLYLYR